MKETNKVGIPAVSGEGALGVSTISIPKLSIGDSKIVQNLRETINDQAEVIAELTTSRYNIRVAMDELKQSIREEGMHVTFSNGDLIDIVDNTEDDRGWWVANGDIRVTNDDGNEAVLNEDDFNASGC